jgi:cardiolipin synthase C
MIYRHTCMLAGLVLATAVFSSGCAPAPLDYPRTASWAIQNHQNSRLGRELEPQLAAHPSQSGFRLLSNGPDALATRLALIDGAEQTLDAQYFLLEDDAVGDLVLDRMLAAAGRGVRVRILIDDWYQVGQDRRLAAIGAHPNVEVRIFNPAGRPRWSALTRPLHYLFGPRRVIKRMHNKAMIVDNTVAIVGGRNIADGYFTVSDDHNFGDLDLLAAGPIAGQVSVAFDEFWNDRLAIPVEAFVPRQETARHSLDAREIPKEFRGTAPSSPYTSYPPGYEPGRMLAVDRLALVWAQGEVVYDRPGKVLGRIDRNPPASVVFKLKEVLDGAGSEALMISPYLVPGESGMEYCRHLRDRGVVVKVLTNSLASTDEVAPHAAYEKYRADLLRCGVQLYELRPDPERRDRQRREDEGRSAGSGLHAKCLIVDQNVVFVGSLNLDPRSLQWDTQNGILVRSEELARQLTTIFARRTSLGYAYRVRFAGDLDGTNDTSLVWIDETNGKPEYFSDEPMTGPGRRLKAWFLSWLAPEAWL